MPFRSGKQEKWMFVHKPEIAKRWVAEYGPKPVKKARSKDDDTMKAAKSIVKLHRTKK